MKKILFLFLIALPLAFGFAVLSTADKDCSCGTPTNVHKTFSNSSSATFVWDAVDGAANYRVKYVRKSDAYQS